MIANILILSLCCAVSAYTGGDCFNERRQKPGLCININNCESAKKNLQNYNSPDYPQICRFENANPYVCCVGSSSPSAKGPSAEEKCKEYGEKYLEVVTDQRNKQIIDGEDAAPGEFPHMAAIGFGDPQNIQWSCGGTLISEKFVVTAAHCRNHLEYGQAKYIQLGDTSLKNSSNTRRTYRIAKIHTHPDYKPPKSYNDIALLELTTNVQISPFIKPACLQTSNDKSTLQRFKMEVTGWGLTEDVSASDTLQKVELQYFDNCAKNYKVDRRKLPEGVISTQICFGSRVDRKDACTGDSGGPIQYFDFGVYLHRVVGVVSVGKGCGVIGSPGIYTRVSSYIDWIEKIVWK